MKIAMIGQKGIPATSGGVERHVEEISKRLVERGHQVTVYNRSGYCDIQSEQYMGINLQNIQTVNKKNLEAIIYSFLASMNCAGKDYDIIHFHALGPVTMSFIPKMFRKKIVVTVHGLDWQRDKWGGLAKAYLKLGERVSAYVPNNVITVSQTLRKFYREKYKKDVCYIPNGVLMPDIVSPNIIKDYGLGKNKYILFLARIVPEKGCNYLLEAFKDIQTDIKLVIAGGSSHTDDYYNSLKKYACEKIIFTGEVRGTLLKELYSNALFYILPSEIEGLPISLLEAMSYGLCPLVSNIEENLEVVNGEGCYGYSFISKNVDSLREKLEFMLNNRNDVIALGQKAKQYVLARYNWDSIAKETENLYMVTMENVR